MVLCLYSQAQKADTVNYAKRKKIIYTSYTTGFIGFTAGLYTLWYKDYPLTSFHFFNDNNQWLQMDKVGHATTAYYLSKTFDHVAQWGGLSKKQSIIQSSIGSLLFLSSIETLDGFSPDWGASYGDIISNFAGVGLYAIQKQVWEDQRIKLKFSSSYSPYAKYRPNLLGSSPIERALKDYNGQTYWLSAGIQEFTNIKKIPKWLNISVGYGASGMTGGSKNPSFDNNNNPLPYFERNREYYLSFDIDLEDIPTKNKALKIILGTLNFIKIPAPTLQINQNGKATFKPFYF